METEVDVVRLYWERDETAIEESARLYGSYLYRIAYNILYNREDSDESVNDTYLAAWNSIPPHKPQSPKTYLAKLTRRIAVDKWRRHHSDKRGGGEMPLILDELSECLCDRATVEQRWEHKELVQILQAFSTSLSSTHRDLFLRRYWLAQPIREIASTCGWSEAKVKTTLYRIRKKLAARLETEGFL